MDENRVYWIWLQQVFGCGSSKPVNLWKKFSSVRCFYEEALYAEFDSSLVATPCVLATAILVLEQLAKLALISELQARDLMHLSSECAYRICDCLMMLAVDPEQSEDEYHQLLKRLKMVEGNSWSFNEGDFSEA